MDPIELKNQLFAWHAPSFYGTFIETSELGPKEGILLPAAMALDYFCHTSDLQHAVFEWDAELTELKKAAPAIREALIAGRCMPDYTKWKQGKLSWKLRLAERTPIEDGIDDKETNKAKDEHSQDGRNLESVKDQGNANPNQDSFADEVVVSPLLREWMDSLISEWVREQPEFQQALQRLEQAHPLLAGGLPADLWLDEEDWLVAIGWKTDSSPFRTCLQLVEPDLDDAWHLQLLLQDRQRPDVLVACTPQGVPADESEASLPEAWLADLARVRKDVQQWLHILPWLRDSAAPERLRQEISHDEAWEFLAQGSLRLVEAGYAVFLPAWWERLRKLKPRIKAKIKSSVGAANDSTFGLGQIMQFDWRLALGDVELTEAEFRVLAEQKRKLVQFRGKWIQLDPTQLEQIQQVMKQVKKKKGLSFRDVMEMHLLGDSGPDGGAPDLASLEEELQMEVELNEHLALLMAQLKQQAAIPPFEAPESFKGSLRHYQSDGVAWMLFLRRFGLGGCLADDMGLGKTIQWITYLLTVKEAAIKSVGTSPQPALLICPTSVLGNWQKELQRFAPSLKAHLHYGPQRLKGEAFAKMTTEVDLVLTSYTLAHLDEPELTALQWGSICIDEAQNIKNAYTKQATAIRHLQGDHRIALTGTPIENRLTELWSILDFLNPGYLGSLREFSHRYVAKIEKVKDSAAIGQVQKLIRPFLLRRVKKDPAIQLDLPDKNEMKAYVSLTAEQASLYENYIQDMFAKLERLKAMERRGLILAALTKLKQVCNHPALLLKEGAQTHQLGRSNKVERLLDMVTELRQEGDRCLIFTQFVETGHLLQNIIQKELKEKVQFLHGGTPRAERERMIDSFQNESADASDDNSNGIFLLSLKAGGTGLNLTAASHVFHFDRWWNPAVENQATDRAFRIGQTRHVQVHKFVTLGTLEERIDEMIERKQGLSQQIVGGGEGWITELSTEDLRDLFVLRRDWVEA
jgi:SNF2 family DNA or RNA helicase